MTAKSTTSEAPPPDLEATIPTSSIAVGVAKGILLAIANFAATACLGWIALSVALGASMANSDGATAILGLGMAAAAPAGALCAFAYIAYAITHFGGDKLAAIRIRSAALVATLRRAKD